MSEGATSRDRIVILDPDGAGRSFRIHKALMLFVNRRLQIAEPLARSKGIVPLPLELRRRP
jgi:hypothetical protein